MQTYILLAPAGDWTARSEDFFLAPLSTYISEDELLTAVTFPNLVAGPGWGFKEAARRSGDFALAGASAVLTLQNRIISDVQLSMKGVDETPRRLQAIEEMLLGRAWNACLRAARGAKGAKTDQSDERPPSLH